MNTNIIVGGIAVLWVAIFAAVIIPNERQVSAPEAYPRVILETRPVDPRDLLRGDFVILAYDFSRPWRQRWERDVERDFTIDDRLQAKYDELPSGTKVYAALQVDAATRRAEVHHVGLAEPKEGLYLTGSLRGSDSWNRELRFGIEKYFVPVGKGRPIERERNAGDLAVEVAIDPDTGEAIGAMTLGLNAEALM
mgnify:CR=1 FL=1